MQNYTGFIFVHFTRFVQNYTGTFFVYFSLYVQKSQIHFHIFHAVCAKLHRFHVLHISRGLCKITQVSCFAYFTRFVQNYTSSFFLHFTRFVQNYTISFFDISRSLCEITQVSFFVHFTRFVQNYTGFIFCTFHAVCAKLHMFPFVYILSGLCKIARVWFGVCFTRLYTFKHLNYCTKQSFRMYTNMINKHIVLLCFNVNVWSVYNFINKWNNRHFFYSWLSIYYRPSNNKIIAQSSTFLLTIYDWLYTHRTLLWTLSCQIWIVNMDLALVSHVYWILKFSVAMKCVYRSTFGCYC